MSIQDDSDYIFATQRRRELLEKIHQIESQMRLYEKAIAARSPLKSGLPLPPPPRKTPVPQKLTFRSN